MPARSYVIDEFVNLSGTTEIIGIGGVRQPRGEAQEVEVAVLVATNMELPTFNIKTDLRLFWIGCGKLDLLVPGSRWERGRRIGWAPMDKVSGPFERYWEESLGEGAARPSAAIRPFPSRPIASSSGFLLRRTDVTTRSMGPELVLLPQMELLRGLFGVSSRFLLELFDGIRNPAISSDRGLVDRQRSSIRGDHTVVLTAGSPLSREEALIAALVVAAADVRGIHDSVFQQLSTDRAWLNGSPHGLNLRWPWREPILLAMEGRWVQRVHGHRRFVAARLTEIGLKLPFRRIEVHHPGAESGSLDTLPPPEGRLRSGNARILILTTGRAASTARRPVEIATGNLEIPSAAGIEIVSIPRGGVARTDLGGIGEDPRDEAPVATADRSSGADADVGRAVVKRKRKVDPDAPSRSSFEALDVTWIALSSAAAGAGWSLDALPKSGAASRDAPHGGLDLKNEPLVACVRAGSGRAFVVDMGSPSGDERSLGILLPENPAMGDRALAASARRTCETINGRWRSQGLKDLKAPDFRVEALNRSGGVFSDPDGYAALLRRRIASILGL